MKNIRIIVLLGILFLCICSCSTKITDWEKDNLKGKVKSVEEIIFSAKQKFNRIEKEGIYERRKTVYNKDGFRSEKRIYRPLPPNDGEEYLKCLYKYNACGKLKEYNLYNDEGETLKKILSLFDKDGNIVKEEQYVKYDENFFYDYKDEYFEISKKNDYETINLTKGHKYIYNNPLYDESIIPEEEVLGKSWEKRYYYHNGNIDSVVVEVEGDQITCYYKKGRPQKTIVDKGVYKDTITYVYKDKNVIKKIKSKEIYKSKDTTFYEYNNKGQYSKITKKYYTNTYKYDLNGRLHKISEDEDDKVNEFNYDESDRLVKYSCYSKSPKISYSFAGEPTAGVYGFEQKYSKFDEEDNWQRCVCLQAFLETSVEYNSISQIARKAKVCKMIIRKIEYY